MGKAMKFQKEMKVLRDGHTRLAAPGPRDGSMTL
jgi:hypothetical protein